MSARPAGPAAEEDLATLAARIERPDPAARVAAQRALARATGAQSSYGRLADAAVFLAGARGGTPVAPARARLVLLGGDPAATATLARVAGLPQNRVCAPAAGRGTTAEALAAGRALADTETDAGTDLLVLAATATGPAARTAAATVTAACTGADAPSVIGAAAGGDADWMLAVAAVRDRLRPVRAAHPDPVAMLDAAGDPELAFLTGLLAGAVARRTPVVIEGVPALAAALLVNLVSGAAPEWLLLVHEDPDPAARLAARHLSLDPLLDLGMRSGTGIAGALSVPLFAAAVALVAG